MKWSWKRSAALGVALMMGLALSGCAQEVGDIDRTQPNKLKKSDLDGTWYMFQKIVDVPATAGFSAGFEGMMTETDKVVFVAEENHLIAYRSYPDLIGSDITGVNMTGENSYEEFYGDDYKGSILAIYPISSHFDVQRTYDPTTGEQSNVIMEDSSDRPWYEREYIRVDWTKNPLVNIEWTYWYDLNYELSYQETAEVDPTRSPYFEYDENGKLQYFDAPGNYIVESGIYECLGGHVIGLWYGDCGSSEIRIVTSFLRDNGDSDYEPLPYDNKMMNRFGYFRTEHYTYDQKHGITESGKIQLAQRHDIWETSYRKDANGDFVLDANGNRLPIPIEDREVKTVGYYVRNLPLHDKYLASAAQYIVSSWNDVFKNAVATVQNKPVSQVKDVFVLCHIPVIEGDNTDVCGPVGFEPREGDFRRNVIWVVDQRQDVGLLGYGPISADPLTGETLSGHAHVYLDACGSVANYLLDQIKFANGDLTIDGVINADVRRAEAKANGEKLFDIARVSDKLKSTGLKEWKNDPRVQKRLANREMHRHNLKKFDAAAADTRLKAAYEAGLLDISDNSVYRHDVAKAIGLNPDKLTNEEIEMLSPYQMFSLENRRARNSVVTDMLKRSMCFSDMIDLKLSGLAHKYAGRTDYDEIWKELRADVFISTTLHEMGHTLGLRHNFSGSYDSLNYFDKFWELRLNDGGKFTKKKSTVADMYAIFDRSDEQLNGGMGEYQYSSIMDYSMGYGADVKGLGKYDQAAITFAYTGGTSRVSVPAGKTCEGIGGSVVNGECLAMRPGYVQVFNKKLSELGKAGAILNYKDTTGTSTLDDLTSIGQPYLELTHYSTFMNSFNDINDAWNRKWVRLDDYLDSKAKDGDNRLVRVPYLFCTDDNEGQIHSCRRFDFGADLMEQMLQVMHDYRKYYPFTEFARDRAYWYYGNAVNRHIRTFNFVSDFFQNWYVSENIDNYTDDLNDTLTFNAVLAGYNFLAEVISTPEYGVFCQDTKSGRLIVLNNDDEANAQENSDYYLDSYCRGGADADIDPRFFYVKQGEGRRRYIKYNPDMGFDYSVFELENGHVYTSWYAILFLFDNEASVIAPGGDIGTYLISMVDYFGGDIINLANSMLDENYNFHSPRLALKNKDGSDITENYGGTEYRSGKLVYPVYSSAHADEGFYYNPETGESVDDLFANTGYLPFGSKCTRDEDCVGMDIDGVEATCDAVMGIGEDNRCLLRIEKGSAASCPEGAGVYTSGSGEQLCYSGDVANLEALNAKYDELAESACSASNWFGKCADANKACVQGVCKEFYPIVESNTSISQMQYLTLFGMWLVSEGLSVQFSDQMQVYKLGSGETSDPGEGYKRVTFTDPFLGTTYAANKLDCSVKPQPIACNSNVNDFTSSGAVRLVERGNELLEDYQTKYNDFFDWYYDNYSSIDFDNHNSAGYKKYLKLLRRWRNSEYALQNHIDTMNYVRSMYNTFAAPF